MSVFERGATGKTFAEQTPAATSGRLVWQVPRDATIEHVAARVYPGAETTMRLRIKKIPLSGSPVDVVDQEGKEWIDGDDDYHEWEPSVPVEEDAVVVVEYQNNDGSNAHNWRVNMTVDYLGGVSRIGHAISQRLGGVL